MRNINRYKIVIAGVFCASFILLNSCKEFLNPDQEIDITEDRLYDDWSEYRSVEMGLYALQADLFEQIIILGELRGDLLQITENAEADMVEVYNFNISSGNKYASPVKFFKLISACNNFLRVLEKNHPEVLNPSSLINNYDRLYGEVLCMRAWAYFNAVRIFRQVPFIHESLTTIEEVNGYVNSSEVYIDSLDITFARNGYDNDTVYNTPVTLEKKFYDQHLVIDHFTSELQTKVKAVGVNHYIDNNDNSWEVTVWNAYAMNTLLGLMYLTDGDLAKAAHFFEEVIYNSTPSRRYQLDASFSNTAWRNIFGNVDFREHILTLWFNKSYFQQNRMQSIFDPRPPHKYMLKPTKQAVINWETIWDNYQLQPEPNNPNVVHLIERGTPGDFNRGYNVSYSYVLNGEPVPTTEIREMLLFKAEEDYRSAEIIVENADTAVWKYSLNKTTFDEDANFIVYRAAAVHLWLAEVYTYWAFKQGSIVREFTSNAVNILNDGSNYAIGARPQLGVRGRVGFGGRNDGIYIGDIIWLLHPFTNKIIGRINITGNFLARQLLLDDYIINERARELAFEGERFYDLIRAAKRRNDPTYLAEKVSEKFPAGKREEIYNLLLNEDNWYINFDYE